MADLKKFLDQSGVSTLWSRVAEEVKKVDDKAAKNAQDIAAQAQRLTAAEGKIDALEKGTYDDTEVRGLIADNKAAHEANAAAIELLNGDAETVGSVANTATSIAATKVAEIVANADADFDTLKEIADWILNDTTGAADMANDIAALQGLVGDKAVATQIAEAISAEGLDKYALAADLTALTDRVKALEDAGYQNADAVAAAIDAKIAALDLANTYDAKGAAATAEANAKAYTDNLATFVGEVNQHAGSAMAEAQTANREAAKAYAAAGKAQEEVDALEAYVGTFTHATAKSVVEYVNAKADSAESAAKAYVDTEINTKIIALSTDEIDAAIAAAKGNA